MNVKILIATHKPYWMPEDDIYLPIHVGAEGKVDDKGQPLDFGYQKDNIGDNISKKNKNYCELTGVYWAWKNLEADYIGIAHYRRHFSNGKKIGEKKRRIISRNEVEEKLEKNSIVLPKPRNYWIETNYSHYVHAHNAIDLDTTKSIIEERYPEYIYAWDKCMQSTTGHRFNMFIMRKDIFDAYCEWLFDVLFQLEKRLDISSYNKNDSRVYGFVSERLLDIWIMKNDYKYIEVPFVFMEKQNWLIKGGKFILRKIKKGESE